MNAITIPPKRKKYADKSVGIMQSLGGIQVSLYHCLDVPHGHRDLKKDTSDLWILEDSRVLFKGVDMQHKIYEAQHVTDLFQLIKISC